MANYEVLTRTKCICTAQGRDPKPDCEHCHGEGYNQKWVPFRDLERDLARSEASRAARR